MKKKSKVQMYVGDKPIAVAESTSIIYSEDEGEGKKDWKNAFTGTVTVENNEAFQKMCEDIEKRREEELVKIEQKFRDLCQKEYEQNYEFYHGVKEYPYPDDMQEWLHMATDKLKMWALREGWNLCYAYHRERIEKSNYLSEIGL